MKYPIDWNRPKADWEKLAREWRHLTWLLRRMVRRQIGGEG